MSARRRSRLFLLGVIAALAFPSGGPNLFAGLPFSEPVEFYAFVLLVVPFANAALRRYLGWRLTRLPVGVRQAAMLVPVAALVIKSAMLLAGPAWGLRGCYVSLSSPLVSAPCERSFEFPFAHRDMTRVDPAVDFAGDSWNLSFVNSVRFNDTSVAPGTILRDRLPFEVEWQGVVDYPEPVVAEAEYVGAGSVTIDGRAAVVLPDSYSESATTRFEIPRGRSRLVVRYRFADRFRAGDEPPGPRPAIALRRVVDAGAGPLLLPAPPAAGIRIAGATADVLVGASLLALLLALGATIRRVLPAFAGWIVAARAAYAVPERSYVFVATATVIGLLACTTTLRRTRWLLVAYVVVALLATARGVQTYSNWHHVDIASAGDDWLSYESQSRSILETGSLEAGEPVFSQQPGYRYIRFLERVVVGDGEPPVIALSFGALLFGVVLLATHIGRAGPLARAVAMTAAGLAVLLLASGPVYPWIRYGLSEVPTWMALPFMLAALFMHRGVGQHVLGVALLAASAVVRINQLPALAIVFAAYALWAWREGWHRRVIWLSLLLVGVLLLPLAHNVYYGGRFVLAATAGEASPWIILPLSDVPKAVAGGAKADVLRSQLTYLLGFGRPLSTDAVVAMRGMQLLWLASAFVALRGKWFERMLHVAPLAYVAPYVVYQVNNYYPRHIVAGFLAMAFVSALQLWFRAKDSQGAPVVLPNDAEV